MLNFLYLLFQSKQDLIEDTIQVRRASCLVRMFLGLAGDGFQGILKDKQVSGS